MSSRVNEQSFTAKWLETQHHPLNGLVWQLSVSALLCTSFLVGKYTVIVMKKWFPYVQSNFEAPMIIMCERNLWQMQICDCYRRPWEQNEFQSCGKKWNPAVHSCGPSWWGGILVQCSQHSRRAHSTGVHLCTKYALWLWVGMCECYIL